MNGLCDFAQIPGCVVCLEPPLCPPVEIVFLMDTSGSMRDEAAVVCANIEEVVVALSDQGIVASPHFLGITEVPADGFACLTGDVVSLLGGNVPGNLDTCPFPLTFSAHESWGPATAIVADRFSWTPGSQRMIVPISDEGACDGSFPDGCNDPGEDRDSITNAIAVANAKDVIVSPIAGTSASECVLTLAADLATGTGGVSFATQDPAIDLAEAITMIIADVCEPSLCDDGNPCTEDDVCVNEVCEGTPLPGCVNCIADDECVGEDACSTGVCLDGVCTSVDNFDSNTYCCDPETGTLTPLDDGNVCTDDVCDPETGHVTHSATTAPTTCDDGDACTVDNCEAGLCVGTPVDCSDLDGDCAVGVCDAQTGLCEAQLTNEGLACTDDGNACTDDLCRLGTCVHTVDDTNFCTDDDNCTDDACEAGECIATPVECSGLDNECVVGVCNIDTGDCEAQATNEGGACAGDETTCMDNICDGGTCVRSPTPAGLSCDDENICTGRDVCDGNGNCAGIDLREIPCDPLDGQPDETCEGGFCDPETGACKCTPDLCFEIQEADGGTCFGEGDVVLVDIVLSRSPPVNGGQYFFTYDPSVVRILPDQSEPSCDPEDSDYPPPCGDPCWPDDGIIVDRDNFCFFNECDSFEEVEPGKVFFALLPVGDFAASGPMVVATIRFEVLTTCDQSDFCFVSENPLRTFMMLWGEKVDVEPCCSSPLVTGNGAATISCPESRSVNAEPGTLAALVTWDSVSATPGCDGPLAVTCTATHSLGLNLVLYIANGGVIPSGVATFECVTDASCGVADSCSWVVNVSSANLVSVDLQLSPTIRNPGPMQRCIEFEFYADCVGEPEVFREVVNFGLPLNFPGYARNVSFKVPANNYRCVTARDPLHTLRAVADMDIDGNRWTARFQGDPLLGGNWLVGGNLDGSRVIDILDLAVLRAAMLTVDDPNTTCSRTTPHADINGDGIVDTLDELFLAVNFLSTDKETCCPSNQVLASTERAVVEISVDELRRTGRGHLAAGDTNGDGWLNLADLPGPLINAPIGKKRTGGAR